MLLILQIDSFVSQTGDRSPVSSAAYLLFYRRRSAEPLGPPSLQKLVQNTRNPPELEVNSAADSEDELAGEGNLGGHRPSSHLHGSSSDGTRAGAGAGVRATNGSNRAVGNGVGTGGQARQQVLSSVNQRATRTNDDDEGIGMEFDEDENKGIGSLNGKAIYGPPRPPPATPPSWNFDSLNDKSADNDADEDGMVYTNIQNDNSDAEQDDAASDMPAQGSSPGSELNNRMRDFSENAVPGYNTPTHDNGGSPLFGSADSGGVYDDVEDEGDHGYVDASEV